MKRDVELFRQILLEIEKQPSSIKGHKISIPGRSDQEVYEHALLVQDAGLIEATFHKSVPMFVVKRLTNEGHDFLEAAKHDTLWNKAKDIVMKNAGTITVTALKEMLNHLVHQALPKAM